MALNLQPGGRIVSLDLPDAYVPDEALFQPNQIGEIQDLRKGAFIEPYRNVLPVELLKGESTSYDFSPWYSSMDLVFIDGGHSLKVIESDSRNALKLIKKEGGIILWHDYLPSSCPDVVRFLNSLGLEVDLRLIAGTKTVIFSSEK